MLSILSFIAAYLHVDIVRTNIRGAFTTLLVRSIVYAAPKTTVCVGI
jgi:hypothetical protein